MDIEKLITDLYKLSNNDIPAAILALGVRHQSAGASEEDIEMIKKQFVRALSFKTTSVATKLDKEIAHLITLSGMHEEEVNSIIEELKNETK